MASSFYALMRGRKRMSKKGEKREKRVCPECGSETLIEDPNRGEMICSRCGIVVQGIIDYGAEWRSYNAHEQSQRSRTGAPASPLKPDYGLRTVIGHTQKDAKGRNIDPVRQDQFNRLRRQHDREDENTQRNLQIALEELKRLKSQLGLSQEVEYLASKYYRMALKEDLIRGRSIDGMMAASVYLACQRTQTPLLLKDIATVSRVDKKELGRCIRTMVMKLNLKLRDSPREYKKLTQKLGDSLGLSMTTILEANKIIQNAIECGITIGKHPASTVGAALYLAGIRTGERRTQDQVAKVASITPVTIRNRFKEMVKVLSPQQ